MKAYYVKHDGNVYGQLTAARIEECWREKFFNDSDVVSEDRKTWSSIQSVFAPKLVVQPYPRPVVPVESPVSTPPKSHIVYIIFGIFLGQWGGARLLCGV